MASIKPPGPPDYSVEEQQALIDFLLALRKSHIQDFLKQVERPSSGLSGKSEEARARRGRLFC